MEGFLFSEASLIHANVYNTCNFMKLCIIEVLLSYHISMSTEAFDLSQETRSPVLNFLDIQIECTKMVA